MKNENTSNELDIIKNEFRKNNLDNALLFMCSFVGFIFSLLEIARGSNIVIYFIPILVLSVILPFFHGYLLGAVFQDSIIERIKGWNYLIYGTFIYSISIFNRYISNLILNVMISNIVNVCLMALSGFLGIKVWQKLVDSIFNLFHYEKSYMDEIILNFSEESSISLAVGSSAIILSSIIKGSGGILLVSMGLMWILLSIHSAYKSYVYHKKRHFTHKYIHKKGNKKLSNLGLTLILISIISFIILIEYKEKILGELSNLIFICILFSQIIGIILYITFKSTKRIEFTNTK